MILDVTVNRISQGIDAVALMSEGLDLELDPRADGFSAICEYLFATSQTLREQLDLCLAAVRRQAGTDLLIPKNSQLF